MKRLITCLALFLVCVKAQSDNAKPKDYSRSLPAFKATTAPTIHGDLSDPAWKAAPIAEKFYDVQNGSVMEDQTKAYLLYDDKYIYVGFEMKDSQPAKITAQETVRDYKFSNNDFDPRSEDSVDVSFDPFQHHRFDERTIFSLNALGTRSVRLAGGRGNKLEWRGDWEGAVKRTPDGWTAEMRIPWVSLNYPSGSKPINISLNFARYQSRTHIMSIWSNIGSQYFFERDGVWEGVQPPVGSFKPKLSLLPYLLPGYQDGAYSLRSGLDVRYTPKPDLTAVASINPDLGTVEGAIQSIQFSRFAKFVPERRPFFLEGQDYFGNDGNNVAAVYFYSQNIPQFDLGTKVYGKLSPKDSFGLMNTVSFASRNDTATSYRHQFSDTSSAGFSLVQKSANDDNNTVGVLNQSTRYGKLRVDTDLALTSGRDSGGDAKHVQLVYADKLVRTELTYNDVTPRFRAADGLVFLPDYRGPILVSNYNNEWRKGFWRRVNVGGALIHVWHTDGNVFARGVELGGYLEARKDWAINLGISSFVFDGSSDATVNLGIFANTSNRFRQYGFFLKTGKIADKPSTFLGPQFSTRIFKKLDVIYNGAIQNLSGVEHQHILTLNYEITPTRSFGGRVVVQGGDTNWYLSYRNSGAKGVESYVILGDPNAQKFQNQFRVKFIVPL